MILRQGHINPYAFANPPSKIICLVPSISWYVYDLIEPNKIYGISKFCEIPPQIIANPIRLGGTKTPLINKIKQSNADLIIVNQEENTKEVVEELAKEFNVYLSEISDITSMFQMMLDLGSLCHRQEIAQNWVQKIQALLSEFEESTKNDPQLKIIYMIWKDPFMAVGNDTFIHSILNLAGFINVLESECRYPAISLEKIKNLEPDFVFLSSEPFPFQQKDQVAFDGLHCILVDGKMFSWYGSYLFNSFAYLKALKDQLNKH